jgi:hypothetical protein
MTATFDRISRRFETESPKRFGQRFARLGKKNASELSGTQVRSLCQIVDAQGA